MAIFKIHGPGRVNGRVSLPGDKSIAHRLVILSCLSENSTTINNFPFNDDCVSTARAFKSLGVELTFDSSQSRLKIKGKGLNGLKKPRMPIFVGESGTTLRLLLGVLAGQDFQVKLTCAESLSQRPMLRVTLPLRKMGAEITCRKNNQGEEYLPITIQGGELFPITYKMRVASAQVKSAILLAGLYAKGLTQVIEPVKTRDHTERLLKAFGAEIKIQSGRVFVKGGKGLVSPKFISVPGDISSAAFFMVLAAITAGSRIILKNVSLNPSRMGVIRVLKRMGASIKVSSSQLPVARFEPMGDIEVRSGNLKGVIIKKEEIPSLIDELPVLMVAACCARGKSRFESVGELRVKETDRIKSMSENLKKMGADIQVTSYQLPVPSSQSPVPSLQLPVARREDIVIRPVDSLKGADVKSFGDHRTAMSMIVAGLSAQGITTIDDIRCISKSFPGFIKVLKSIIQK
ncbi:MAG: 3-phosphoshikimate 1-carboxyvinyltransferase [Candidatus Omnitrophota bacterium]